MVRLTFPHVAILSVALSIGQANPAQQKIVIDQDEGSGSMEMSSIQFEGKMNLKIYIIKAINPSDDMEKMLH